MKPSKRRYVLRERAERQAQTRRRIVEATVALHQEVGPQATQISEVARRAGVQRATVYNHFPDEGALLAACSAHWRSLHPAPDIEQWKSVADVDRRLRLALGELYRWYRETAQMTGNVLRDAQSMPALHEVIEPGLLRYLSRVSDMLAEQLATDGPEHERTVRAARAVVDFSFWQALQSLGDDDAAHLGASLVEIAAR